MQDKSYPRYDDIAHIDSGALNHKDKKKKTPDYTIQYLAPLNGADGLRMGQGDSTV